MTPYSYETTGRNRKTLIALIIVWAALVAALLLLGTIAVLAKFAALPGGAVRQTPSQ